MSGDNKKTVTFFHYTDGKSREAIEKSGVIKQSEPTGRRDDAVFGAGTYGTSMAPHNGKKAIAQNNYDDSKTLPRKQMAEGKVDYVFKVQIPKDKVVKENAGGRDVLRHQGDIHLKDYPYTVHTVQDTNATIRPSK